MERGRERPSVGDRAISIRVSARQTSTSMTDVLFSPLKGDSCILQGFFLCLLSIQRQVD